MENMSNVFQYPFAVIKEQPFPLKGQWREGYFKNNNPIVLELGCGKGEYTVGLAKLFPDINFIGIDIKGARMWTGAKQALQENLQNVAFLRTSIELIEHFFSTDEVQQIWLTFSDPQMKNLNKRLTSTVFMNKYRSILEDNGIIHVKTDSNFLFMYTKYMIEKNNLPIIEITDNLYNTQLLEEDKPILNIQTYYEQMWMSRGIDIKYIKFRLPKQGELQEPDVEIPLDEYRSYHRDKRTPRQTAK